jgi:hypothetical protein
MNIYKDRWIRSREWEWKRGGSLPIDLGQAALLRSCRSRSWSRRKEKVGALEVVRRLK